MAVQALTFLAEDPDRLARFLDLSGLDPGAIRASAGSPGFLSGVLDYLAGDEPLLLEFAQSQNLDPAWIETARMMLAGRRGTA
jgi:hypothetical protein